VETCNIDELLSNVPDRIEFSFGASTGNPPGSTEQNFILDNSAMSLEAEVILPMWLSTSGYTLRQTLDLELDSILPILSLIDSATFRLTTINEWPLGISIQINFLDDGNEIISSLFDAQTVFLNPAPVNADGELDRLLLEPYIFEVQIAGEDLSELDEAKSIELVATVATSSGASAVKFYSQYLLNYQLSINANSRINTSELNF
jgi:hypothetical protein